MLPLNQMSQLIGEHNFAMVHYVISVSQLALEENCETVVAGPPVKALMPNWYTGFVDSDQHSTLKTNPKNHNKWRSYQPGSECWLGSLALLQVAEELLSIAVPLIGRLRRNEAEHLHGAVHADPKLPLLAANVDHGGRWPMGYTSKRPNLRKMYQYPFLKRSSDYGYWRYPTRSSAHNHHCSSHGWDPP
jgi:hypothetical protein